MNFFQKLTGSLKMPQEEELFSEKSPETHSAPPASQAPNLAPQPQNLSEESADKLEIKTTSFKEMFAQQTVPPATEGSDDDTENVKEGDEETEGTEEEQASDFESPIGSEEDSEGTFVTAQLAKAKTQVETRKTPVISALKKTIPHIRFKKEEGVGEAEINAPEGQLAIDVYEMPTEVVIKSTIAGVKPEDLDVGIEENTVNIRGSRHNEEKVKGEDYFYQECYWGTFSRSIILPVEVDADEAQASLKDGILTIRLPKIIKEKEKKIKILS